MKIKLFNENAVIPKKSHDTDGGFDMFLCEDILIEPNKTQCFGLGVGFEIPKGYAGIFVPRSSIAKKGLVIQTSLVDPGYTGETHLIITNTSNNFFKYNKGDRLCSIVFLQMLDTQFEVTEEFDKSERGESGLGSTGK